MKIQFIRVLISIFIVSYVHSQAGYSQNTDFRPKVTDVASLKYSLQITGQNDVAFPWDAVTSDLKVIVSKAYTDKDALREASENCETSKSKQLLASVYVLGGQSNMLGKGKLEQLSEDWKRPLSDIFFWNGHVFQELVPGKTITSGKGEFGPEMGFARGLREAGVKGPVYLIKFASGGQPLYHGWNGNEWNGGDPAPNRCNFYPGKDKTDPCMGTLYREWITICNRSLDFLQFHKIAFKIRGVLWMQGEADAKSEISAIAYATSLKHLKERLNNDLGDPDIPWVFGQVLPYSPALTRFIARETVRAQMEAADSRSEKIEAISGVRMVSTDELPLYPDHVHYTTEGQKTLGMAFAKAMLEVEKQDK